jgi:uncharacterized protein YfdQ (DUF2303 family)
VTQTINHPCETSAAVEAGRKAATLEERFSELVDNEDGPLVDSVPVYLAGDGSVRLANDVFEAFKDRAPGPRRREGSATLTELPSFLAYLARYNNPQDTVVFANLRDFAVRAVFDYHPAGPDHNATRWGEHGAEYVCPRSAEWKTWTENDGKPLSQDKFADFIEANLHDITTPIDKTSDLPGPVDVLEMARNLMVRTAGQFQRSINPTTGESSLINKTEHGAESTKIHKAFVVALRVFEGGELYQVEARVRFELKEGRASFTYKLHRREAVERDAFGDVVRQVAATGVPVFAGQS